MARSPIRIRTKGTGRRLTGSCTKAQASAFLTRRKVALNAMLDGLTADQRRRYHAMVPADQHIFETKHGVPARDGNCTFQSAEYVLRFGGDAFSITRRPRGAKKAKAVPRERGRAPWLERWTRFPFDR